MVNCWARAQKQWLIWPEGGLHRRGLVWAGPWRLSRSHQLPVFLKRAVSFLWHLGRWSHRLFIGTQWCDVGSHHREQENLSPLEDRGRDHHGSSCLGQEYPTSTWWGALSSYSHVRTQVPSLHFVMKAPGQCPRCSKPSESQKLVLEKSLVLRAFADLPSRFIEIWHLRALLRSINLGISVSIWVSSLQMR